MEINSQRSHWKTYLAIAGIIILVISLVYTSYLAQRLREGERNKALLLFDAYQTINDQSNPESPDLEADLTLPTNIIVANNDIPIMVVSETDEVLYAKNFGEDLDTCLLYTSDAADERSSVDLGGRRIIKKKNTIRTQPRVTLHNYTRT